MEKHEILNFLKDIELFKDLSDEEVNSIVGIISLEKFKEDTRLFEENSPRESMYIICDGKMELLKRNPLGHEKVLRIFEAGEFIGEGSLMDNYPHSTSARIIENSELIVIPSVKFNELLNSNAVLGGKILSRISRLISRRMRIASSQLVGAQAQYASGKTRTEHDLLGYREVPDEYYYGVQTLRGMENFHITGIPLSHYPNLVKGLAQVKMAAAIANHRQGVLEENIKDAIVKASQEIINGKFHNHFVVDMIQGGAGTSTNMNANEVIANRALEIMGHKKGEYDYCHPNNHVNLSQSTNDAYPTAMKLALYHSCTDLISYLKQLIASFRNKGVEFSSVIKMGRTQLQDAVPMTLGQEFEAFAATLEEEILRLSDNAKLFLEHNMGGTAIGTGINAEPGYAELCNESLKEVTGLNMILSPNLVEATQDTGSFVIFSSAVKRLAVKLSKICNDLRLLSSGPRCGLGEINLPPMQPGSSIMPGKVNPVIPEVVNQIAFKVIGNDLTVTIAAEAGQLQLNVMEPVIVQSIFDSLEMLKNGISTLKYSCIDGITANVDKCREYVYNSIGLVTALNPVLGYEISTNLAKEALETNRGVYELVLEKNLLSKEKLDEILDPQNMIKPRKIAK